MKKLTSNQKLAKAKAAFKKARISYNAAQEKIIRDTFLAEVAYSTLEHASVTLANIQLANDKKRAKK